MDSLKWKWVYLNIWRIFPVCLFIKLNFHKDKCKKDCEIWINKTLHGMDLNRKWFVQIGYILLFEPAFVNVILNRLHRNIIMWMITRILFRPLSSLYINIPPENIGGGLYFQHGFSTVIAAKSIGKNCSINQQVTIGYCNTDCPIIGDNVTITAGAIVIGDVRVENDAVIGAGAVVTKDVPKGAVVAGVPAKILRIDI